MQDLKSIFRLYFEKGGENVHSPNGETLVYQSKQSYAYDFVEIKDVLEEIGALHKAVKLNNNFVDRLVSSNSISQENREKLAAARQMMSETRNIHVLKPEKKSDYIYK
jgi:hypothetical protein